MKRAFRIGAFAVAATLAMTVASVAAASSPTHNGRAAIPLADGDPGVADLRLEGTVAPVQVAVGDSLTWQITVNDYNTGPALDVWVDITLPTNVQLTSSYTDRGTGCTSTGTNTLHCSLDWLADTAQFGHVILVTKVTATGDHVLTAVTGYRAADPVPADNHLTLTATTPSPPPPPPVPVIGSATIAPGPVAGRRVTVSFPVTRSDNGAPLTEGTITVTCSASVAGKAIKCAGQSTNGVARLSFVVPKTAKGKRLKVGVTIVADGQTATKAASFPVH